MEDRIVGEKMDNRHKDYFQFRDLCRRTKAPLNQILPNRRQNEKENAWGSWMITAIGLVLCGLLCIQGFRTGVFSSQEVAARFVERFGLLGPMAFVGLQAVQVVFPILPGGISCLAGVLLFGPGMGFLYNYIGICIGSVMAFQAARQLGAPACRRAAENRKLGRYFRWMENGTFDRWFTLAIFFPVAPDDLLCYLAGMTRMSFRKFLLVILLGKPASIAIYSLGLQAAFRGVLQLAQ